MREIIELPNAPIPVIQPPSPAKPEEGHQQNTPSPHSPATRARAILRDATQPSHSPPCQRLLENNSIVGRNLDQDVLFPLLVGVHQFIFLALVRYACYRPQRDEWLQIGNGSRPGAPVEVFLESVQGLVHLGNERWNELGLT